ncbi:hypothetical protein Nepgr_000636 [Nepenthes gracilis]|uniref:Transmembrane protein n=1 Tax=Nepenthes gracilis TaxID=150966 RepID=A0AAD3P429_NEPGR|nr:hypothetical protein Nepgr_000636 [Nepenthes gracilis]
MTTSNSSQVSLCKLGGSTITGTSRRPKKMKASAYCLLFSLLIFSCCTTRAQDRAPHGLSHEKPVAFSPLAYDFFHPDAHHSQCDDCSSHLSPYPLAAHVRASEAQQSEVSTSQAGLGVGRVIGIVFGAVFVVILAMGAYYAVITRRANLNQANCNSVQPHV